MKSLILALCLLGFSSAFAGPGDGPIFPWPTGIETKELVAEDIDGDWVAYSNYESYYVHFSFEPESPYRVSVLVKPTNSPVEDRKPRLGLGYWGRHVYWGHISMDGEFYTDMVIFRDKGSLKMRIGKPAAQKRFIDLRLERWPWGKPL